MASYRIGFKPSVKLDLKAIPQRKVLTILHAISNLNDNPFPPQSKTPISRGGWRLRVVRYRVTYTVSGGDITPVIVKVAHRKNIDKGFYKTKPISPRLERCMIKPVISC